MVAMGMPETSTTGLGTVGMAWPPWEQRTVAPMCKIGAGMLVAPCVCLRADDGECCSVDDVNAGFVDHDHGSGSAFEDDAAGDRCRGCVADQDHVLALGLQADVL